MRTSHLALLIFFTPFSYGQQNGPETEPNPLGTRLVDLDGDGTLDMLVHHADGSLLVRTRVGPRDFLDVVQELPYVRVTDVLAGDLDGDGLCDLYLVSPGADVALMGEGGGHFREATRELGLVESGLGISAERVDVDGDGLVDLLLHNRGSDVLFWARAGGGFEREERTSDGNAVATNENLAPTRNSPADENPENAGSAGNAGTGGRNSLSVSNAAPTSSLGSFARGATTPPGPPTAPAAVGTGTAINIDARYVNDNMNEVDSADIVDGSLTGADVSTSGGDVTFGGGATVTAEKGLFGSGSTASGSDSTVSGGYGNTASNGWSTVSGGYINTASGKYSTVSGGYYNLANGLFATVSGGGTNLASAHASVVSGGQNNVASGNASVVSGGQDNLASSFFATVSGGRMNTAQGNYSFAAGLRAKANHQGAFVWGDSVEADKTSSRNDEFNVYAEGGARVFAVGQTTPSLVVDPAGAVGIGTSSPGFALEVNGVARAQQGTFGQNASVSGSDSTVSGGYANSASNAFATVSGGRSNAASGADATASGGAYNTVSGSGATVSGGAYNTASGVDTTVSGGGFNTASSFYSTVSGGSSNTASGDYSTVAGGRYNAALGAYGFAAGRRAKADHQGAFVWGDSVDADKSSSANDEFNVYASGGARIFSNSAATTGVLLAAGGGSWTSVSDRNAKENFEAVDGREVLERLVAIPVSTWNYKSQDDAIRHMGPMAQDFWAAFALGLGDTSIDTIDPDGVALAAIQGLHELLEEQQARLAEQEARSAERQALLEEQQTLSAERQALLERQAQRIERLEKGLEALKASSPEPADAR